MSLGPVMVDVAGLELTDVERERLRHPLVGGVILFARNYSTPDQLHALTHAIRGLRHPHLLIATDQEGGRVQRFRHGFTLLPAMGDIGRLWDRQPHRALHLAQDAGYVMAAELRAHGVDVSFAPVLDIDYGRSAVIGNRAFHADPSAVGDLAMALMSGMHAAGMQSVAKHFPGHGWVEADSHLAEPVDQRPLRELEQADLLPYRRLFAAGLAGVMPAHVRYARVDVHAAGFSRFWLGEMLRARLGFDGAVFSDDLSMEGAGVAGDIVQRSQAALDAGCDMLLVCNNPAAADQVLGGLAWKHDAINIARRARLHGRPRPAGMTTLLEQPRYLRARHAVASFGHDNGDFWRNDAGNTCGLSGT